MSGYKYYDDDYEDCGKKLAQQNPKREDFVKENSEYVKDWYERKIAKTEKKLKKLKQKLSKINSEV